MVVEVDETFNTVKCFSFDAVDKAYPYWIVINQLGPLYENHFINKIVYLIAYKQYFCFTD